MTQRPTASVRGPTAHASSRSQRTSNLVSASTRQRIWPVTSGPSRKRSRTSHPRNGAGRPYKRPVTRWPRSGGRDGELPGDAVRKPHDTVYFVEAMGVLNVTDVTRERQQAGSIKARLTLRGVVGEALTLYAREPGRIALTALVTFLPIDVLTVQLHGWSRHFLEIGHTGLSGGTEFIIF